MKNSAVTQTKQSERPGHSSPEGVPRRSFFIGTLRRWAEVLVSSGVLARSVLPALASVTGLVFYSWMRFLWPNRKQSIGAWQRLSHRSDLPADSVDGRWVTSHGVWIVRRTDQGRDRLFVLRAACTHLGCTTQWDPSLRQFICPCHGSAFSLDGERLRGPATRAMDRYAVRLTSDGFIEVRLESTVRRPQSEIEYS